MTVARQDIEARPWRKGSAGRLAVVLGDLLHPPESLLIPRFLEHHLGGELERLPCVPALHSPLHDIDRAVPLDEHEQPPARLPSLRLLVGHRREREPLLLVGEVVEHLVHRGGVPTVQRLAQTCPSKCYGGQVFIVSFRPVTRAPIAYIRRSSKSRSDPGDVSREFQTDAVRRLAGETANLVILDGDWGVSAATESTHKRLAFLGLMESVERGEVSTLYAYSTDRLARSVQWAARLLDACETAGTSIVTNEGTFAPGDDMARTMFQFQAITNEAYSRQAKAKRRSTIARQRERGTKLGQPFYGALPGEDLRAVIAAFQQTGSLNATAIELNRLGVPARRTRWAHSSVQRILARAGLVPHVGTKGAKLRADHTFHRLLRCHCGHTMTGSRRTGGSTVYRCLRAESSIDHERKSIAEATILRWAEVEMGRMRPPKERVVLADLEAERHALTARLDRLRVAFLADLVDEASMRQEKAAIDDALTRLDLQGRTIAVPAFSWDHEPRDLNLALRALWDHVQLGPDLRPLHARWLVPETWLADPAQGSPAAPQS